MQCITCTGAKMKTCEKLWRRNSKLASSTWGKISQDGLRQLKLLTTQHSLSVNAGDLQLLNGRWYVTHAGMLGIARKKRCSAISTTIVEALCNVSAHRW